MSNADVFGDPVNNGPVSADARINVSSAPGAFNADVPTATPTDAAIEQCNGEAKAGADSDVPDSRDEDFHDLAEIIKSCTAPTGGFGKWAYLNEQNVLLRIDMALTEFVAVLAQDYPVELLVDFGFYELVGDELRPASFLNDDGPLFVEIDEHIRKLRFL